MFSGKKVLYLVICRHRHAAGLWALAVGESEHGFNNWFGEYNATTSALSTRWKPGMSLKEMKTQVSKTSLDSRNIVLIMSHPDWELRLKPLGAIPEDNTSAGDSTSMEDRTWEAWVVELIEGLAMLMFGSQQEISLPVFGRATTSNINEPAKTYDNFSLH